MTKRVQVLKQDWIDLDCVDHKWNIINKHIKHLSIVEITDYSFTWTIFNNPNSLRVVDKPKPRYYDVRVVWIWVWIITLIIWIFLWKIL